MGGMDDQQEATDEDADAILGSLGIGPPKTQDENSVMRELGLDPDKRDEDNANLLSEIDVIGKKQQEPLDHAKELKE